MRVAHIGWSVADTSATAAATGRPSLLARLFITIGRAYCALRGHVMVRHFEPGRMSLRCLACGAQTAGWTIDVRPGLRLAWPPRPIVHRRPAASDRRPRIHAA